MEKVRFEYSGRVEVQHPDFEYIRNRRKGFFTLPADFSDNVKITGTTSKAQVLPVILTRTARAILNRNFTMKLSDQVQTAGVNWENENDIIVEVNPNFYDQLDRPCKDFVLFHELAHTIAPRMSEGDTESFCDRAGLETCIGIGWNPSQLIPIVGVMAEYHQFPDRRYKDFVGMLKKYV